MIVSLAIAALIISSMIGMISGAFEAGKNTQDRNNVARDGRFAMQRMARTVSRSRHLVLPLPENVNTPWSESNRNPGVIAVTMDPELDRDSDGVMDADNDADGLIDEDLPDDNNFDGAPGILGIDDDGDGLIDEHAPDDGTPGWSASWYSSNNDEDLDWSEEVLNGIDDDGDGAIDEDINGDMDLAWRDPGRDYHDDDGDGTIDEDWYDLVVYHLDGSNLLERMPNLNPTSGADFTESVIAEKVVEFQVIRLATNNSNVILLDITLVVGDGSNAARFQTKVRVGAGL